MEARTDQINGLVQERSNSSALAMELRLSCTNQSKMSTKFAVVQVVTYIFLSYHKASMST